MIRKFMLALVVAALLTVTLVAVGQEDEIAEYANLDQLGHVIDGFVAGEEIEGLTIDAADDATSAIVRQFQITTNLVSGPTFGKEGIDFVPVGFSEGSTTELDNLEAQFDGTIGESGVIPPLAPWSRVGDEIDVSALFEGWAAYGDRGLIEGPIIINPSVQTIWGMELTEPIGPTCPETRFVGRSWVSEAFDGPDPLFTAVALEDAYGGTHQDLVGSGGRLIEFVCGPSGSAALARRMRDEGDIRIFGPTGVMALVKDNFVVFFVWVEQLDGQLNQFFYASPPDGSPVVVSEVETDDLLLLPNPYEQYPVRVSIILDGDEQAFDETPKRLVYTESAASGVRVQTGGGCALTDREFFFAAAIASTRSGFARTSSLRFNISSTGDTTVLTTPLPNGSTETVTIDFATGAIEAETSSGCTATGTALVDGVPIGDGSAADDGTVDPTPTDNDSTSEAGEESDPTQEDESSGIPWGPIALALALLAAITALAVNRTRTKKDCKPEEEALDSAIIAAKLAHEAWKPLHAALDNAIANDASAEAIAEAQAAATQAADAASLAQETVVKARSALQACKGESNGGGEIDPSGVGVGTTRTRTNVPETDPEPEDGDAPSDPDSPSVYGETDEPVDQEEKCKDGEEKVLPDASLQTKTFTVPAGNIVIRSTMGSWNRAMGGPSGLTPTVFGDLTRGDLEEALADFDTQPKKVRIHPKIQIAVYTVECGYVHRCTPTGEWVQTDEIRHLKTTRTVSSMTIGSRNDSPSKDTAVKHVQEAQKKLDELLEEQDAFDDYECG